MDWMPIKSFDYEAERRAQGTIFVCLYASDGERVALVEAWGPDEWYDPTTGGWDGPDPLGWMPTLWQPFRLPPPSPVGRG